MFRTRAKKRHKLAEFMTLKQEPYQFPGIRTKKTDIAKSKPRH